MTTPQDAHVRIASITSLTEDDLADMQSCNPIQLAALMRGYENSGKVSGGSSAWNEIAAILADVVQYAPLGSTILRIVSRIAPP